MTRFRPSILQTMSLCMTLPLASARANDNATKHEEPTELGTVTVTASPLDQEELHIAQPVRVLRGTDLERRQAPSIGETLTHELGVSSTAFGPGASRPIIRGLGGSRVRVLEGGIGSMDVSNLSDDHAVPIDATPASQIEILKGPASLLYGSGAVGGVVNVVNNRIPTTLYERPVGELGFRYDAATNQRAGNGTVDAAWGPIGLHFDGLRRDTGNYAIPDDGSGNQVLANSDTSVENLAGGASYIGERGYLGFALNGYGNTYGIPGEGARIQQEQLRYDLAGELRSPFAGFSRARFKLGHNDYQHQEFEPGGEVGTTFLNDEYEGRVELTHLPILDFRGVVGVQIQHRDFAARGEEQLTPPVTGTSVGLFAVEERDWKQWHFEIGARYENVRYSPSAVALPDEVRHDVYSVSGGTVWQFREDHSAGLSMTRALRAPSIEELFNRGPHEATQSFEIGNAALEPEAANSLDFTLRRLKGPWTWRLNTYANYIQDFIFGDRIDANGDGLPDAEEDLQVLLFRQHDAIFYGAEAETTWQLVRNPAVGDVDVRLFMDYVRAKLTDGNNLPRIPPLRFGLGLNYMRGALSGDFEIRRVQDQDDSAALETTTSGYTLVNLGINYRLSTGYGDASVSLRGTNLLDETIRYHTSLLKEVAPQPGRSVMLAVKFSF